MTKIYKNYIDGKWEASRGGGTFDNVNPANSKKVLGRFQQSSQEDVDDAVAASAASAQLWRNTPAPKRGEILFRAGELLLKQKKSLARDMTSEMGKVIRETSGDVQEAIDMAYYSWCGVPDRVEVEGRR